MGMANLCGMSLTFTDYYYTNAVSSFDLSCNSRDFFCVLPVQLVGYIVGDV